MSTDFFRNYIDIIKEAEEGMLGRSQGDKRYLPKFDVTDVMNISDDPGIKGNRTSLQGSMRVPRKQLEFAFGPCGDADTWTLEFGNGLIATIYPDSDGIPGQDWKIGGTHPDTEDFVHAAYLAANDNKD